MRESDALSFFLKCRAGPLDGFCRRADMPDFAQEFVAQRRRSFRIKFD
jgi:hypothetical protein